MKLLNASGLIEFLIVGSLVADSGCFFRCARDTRTSSRRAFISCSLGVGPTPINPDSLSALATK